MKAKKANNSDNASPSQTGKRHEINAPGKVSSWVATEVERQALFDELRNYDIPENLLNTVGGSRCPQAAVTWLNDKGAPANPNDVPIEPVVAELKLSSYGNREPYDLGPPKRAGDALAKYLHSQFVQTRAEKVPVRSKKKLAPSIIARIAIDILERYAEFGHHPGRELIDLLRALLNVDKPRLDRDREFEARLEATIILAQKPDVGIRDLARLVSVNASSVWRWRQDKSFWEEVERSKRFIEYAKRRGIWPITRKDASGHTSIELNASAGHVKASRRRTRASRSR